MTHHIVKSHWPLLLVLPLFVLLLARNPFSERTLIANFEPFPDSFHYITTVRCWLTGQGWQMCREGRTVDPMVPPVYSWWLVPFFLVNNDPRMFYFANVIASLLGLSLFNMIIKKIELKQSTQFFLLLLFVTNYYLYWLPSLAMAEVVLIPLFLLLLLCMMRTRLKWKVLGVITAALLYGTKYAAAPLVISGGIIFILQAWFGSTTSKQRWQHAGIISLTCLGSLLVLKGEQFFVALLDIGKVLTAGLLHSVAQQAAPEATIVQQTAQVTQANWAFSTQFIPLHFPEYMKLAIGKSGMLLWKSRPLLPFGIGVLSVVGLVLSLFVKKYRALATGVVLLLFSQILFMSSFYSVDARYVIIAIPSLLVGFALLLKYLELFLEHKRISLTIPFVAAVGALTLLLVSASRLKFDVMLNLKYAETPWWYLSIEHINAYFAEANQDDRPIIITAIPPYLVDFYSNQHYQVMPLSQNMDFAHLKKELFGEYDFSDLPLLYTSLLQQGKQLYVTPYGIGNVPQRNDDWKKLEDSFVLKSVAPGCYELCTIFEVTGVKGQ